MDFIAENIIDQKIEEVSDNKDASLKTFSDAQSNFAEYLFSDQFSTLNKEEANLLLFIVLVLFKSTENKAELDFDLYLEKEELNWTFFEENSKLSWAQKLDACFEKYPQEDLLAFVEDLLSEEQEEITAIGKEFIFVTAKSYIDSL